MKTARVSFFILTLALSSSAWAQRFDGPPDRAARQLLAQLEEVEAESDVRVAVLRRDAFIVAQMAAATGELHDFQKGSAVQKALDRVSAANRRAAERPPANPEVIRLLGKANASLVQARERGFSTDYAALARELDTISSNLQPYVFRDIIDMQKLRIALAELQTRVSRMTQELDTATGEVLVSTLEEARSGE